LNELFVQDIVSQEEFEDRVDALAHVGCLSHRLLDFFKHQRTEASKSLLRWRDSIFNPLSLLEDVIRLYLRRTSAIKISQLQQDGEEKRSKQQEEEEEDDGNDEESEEKTKEEKSCADLVAEKKKKMFKQLTRDLINTLKQLSSILATEEEKEKEHQSDHTTNPSNRQRKLD